MPGYAFPVTITLKNPTDTEKIVKIPRGTIIEPEPNHLTYQSAVIAKDYIFKLNPKETCSVMLDAECWNEHLSPPSTTPGKLTPLKGDIKKTPHIWETSSSPRKKTIHAKPSQDSHIFAAFANTSPQLAREFLKQAIQWAESDGVDVSVISKDLKTISLSSFSSSIIQDKLCNIAKCPELTKYVTATKVREFFIRKGEETEEILSAIEGLITNLYAITTHTVASDLYQLTRELEDLSNDRNLAVTDERRRELITLIRQKYTSILDAFPLLDEIEWTK